MAALIALLADGNICAFFGFMLVLKLILSVAAALDG